MYKHIFFIARVISDWFDHFSKKEKCVEEETPEHKLCSNIYSMNMFQTLGSFCGFWSVLCQNILEVKKKVSSVFLFTYFLCHYLKMTFFLTVL